MSDDRRAGRPGGRDTPGSRRSQAGGQGRGQAGGQGRGQGRGQGQGEGRRDEGHGRRQGLPAGQAGSRHRGSGQGPRTSTSRDGGAAAGERKPPAGRAPRTRVSRPADRSGTAAPRRSGQAVPAIPDHIAADQLDPSVRAELRTLPRDLADRVARHLAAADQATDPEAALAHAIGARQLAARVGAVREACGVAAYLAGHWAEALSELRAARRLSGRAGYLAMMADCERALGRYDRALALVTGTEAAAADRAEQIELRIVESGIRRDMGAIDAAVVVLQVPELTQSRLRPWSARLFYAYADALLDAGRGDEAREWFGRAAAADTNDETDAAERFEELDEVTIEDLEDGAAAGEPPQDNSAAGEPPEDGAGGPAEPTSGALTS